MACYIRKMTIVNEYNEVIYKIEDAKIDKSFAEIIKILKTKGDLSKKSFLTWLDDELRTWLGFDKNG